MTATRPTAPPEAAVLPPNHEIAPDDLLIGGCSARELADEHGTPLLVVDEDGLREHARDYTSAFRTRHDRTRICFAVKAFPSVSMIRVLVDEGLGCDVVGGGELAFALAAGADPVTIVMHGNAKTDDDLRAALDADIGFVAVDNTDDVDRLVRLTRGRAARVPVLLRVAPGVESHTHAALATGGHLSKFGVPAEQVPDVLRRLGREPSLDLRGLHAHIGSQLGDLSQFEQAVEAIASFGHFDVYDLGGGLGVRYLPADTMPTLDEYADALVGAAHARLGADVQLMIEPGRSMVAPFAVTLYRVVTVKRGPVVHVAVDGGMGDNLEPSLYGQRFAPMLVGRWDEQRERVDLVGRHCESGDVVTPGVDLVPARVDDLVVVPVTGAYCFTMANTYNAAPRIPVVYCRGGVARLGVRRDTAADLFAREVPPADLAP